VEVWTGALEAAKRTLSLTAKYVRLKKKNSSRLEIYRQ
jgi:hypothetical protein